MSHRNYKQKYLEALAAHRVGPIDQVDSLRHKVEGLTASNTDAALALRKVSSAMGEVNIAARSLLSEMDDHKHVAGLEFGVVAAEIDANLTRMPADIALRRVRDMLKIAEARIGMLTIQADDLYIANRTLTQSVERVESSRLSVTRALYETSWIGASPTKEEIEDFNDAPAGEYHRDGLVYNDDADDFIATRLLKSSTARTGIITPSKDMDNNADGDESSSDEETGKVTSNMTLIARQRASNAAVAQIRQRSKIDV